MGSQRDIPKVVVIDFDGTLCRDEFPNEGSPEPNVREALLKMKELGYVIKIHSCRTATYWGSRKERLCHFILIQEFMKRNQLPYDEIITSESMDKPVAEFYIDDKAIRYTGNWLDVVKQIERTL
jgi:hypothetical protein